MSIGRVHELLIIQSLRLLKDVRKKLVTVANKLVRNIGHRKGLEEDKGSLFVVRGLWSENG